MPLILGTNSIKDTGFDVANSLRITRDDSNPHKLDRTPSSTSNRRTWTWSGWIKRGILGVQSNDIFNAYDSSGFWERFYFNSSDILEYDHDIAGQDFTLQSTMKFRDPSAWLHLVVAKDTTQSTESSRLKIYVNGTQIALTEVSLGYPTQNYDGYINTQLPHTLGSINNDSNYDGYMAEVVMVDGQQLDPTSFGEFDEDTGIWKPIDVSGLTFGTNGFYLDFENSGSLGADVSGNGNNFTVNNLTSVDQSTDTCTNNFATFNPLDGHIAHVVFSEGNLKSDFGSTASKKSFVRSTIGVASGKWYFEAKVIQNANFFVIGISDRPSPSDTTELGYGAYDYAYANDGGSFSKGNNGTFSSYGDSYTTNDIIGVAVDLDNNKIYFSKNGTFQNSGNPTNGTNPAFTITAPSSTDHGFYFFCVGDMTAANNAIWSANFGSPSYSESGGNSDGNGYGNFAGSVPSGYYALNTKNLAEYG
mgnify:CR=1 FL=1